MIKAIHEKATQLKYSAWIKDFAIVLGASFLIGLLGPCKVFLPFTMIPFALQSSMAILLSFYLGANRAVAATALFIVQGIVGMPFFAGANSGLSYFLGGTGGYIVGYMLAAYLAGTFARNMKSEKSILALVLASHYVVFIPGVIYLAGFIGYTKAFLYGAVPFLVGDFVKSLLVTKMIIAFAPYQQDLESL